MGVLIYVILYTFRELGIHEKSQVTRQTQDEVNSI